MNRTTVTLKDIAKAAGVSMTTVSYVLNNKGSISEPTRLRVKAALRGLGYQRKGSGSGNLGLIAASAAAFQEPLYQAVAEYGYGLNIFSWDSDIEKPPEFRVRNQIAGIFIYGGLWKRDFLKEMVSMFPAVLLGGWVPDIPSDSVWVDNAGSIYNAVEHLVGYGHRSIALINGPYDSTTSIEKRAGFEQALRDLGHSVKGVIGEARAFDPEAGKAVTYELLRRATDITAVIAGEVSLAFGALSAFRELGLDVPGEISLISFRDDPEFHKVGQGRPDITAIPIPELAIAREAVRCLVHRIENPLTPGRRILFQPSLVRRGSVAAPRIAAKV